MSTVLAPPPMIADPPDDSRGTRAPGRLRATLAGVEAAVFAWLCVVVPAVASYVATASAPALGEATWLNAAAVGSGIWRLAHGGAMTVDGAQVAVVPLGVTALAAGAVAFSVRRARVRTWAHLASAVLGYAVACAILASLVPVATGGPWLPLLGGALVAAAGSLVAVARTGGLPPVGPRVAALLERFPLPVRDAVVAGVRGAGVALAGLLALGALLVLVSLAANHALAGALLSEVGVNPFGAAMLVVVSLVLLPAAAVWAVSWLAGPGFAVGQGTIVSPDAVVAGPYPAFPLAAAIPGPSPLRGWTALAVLLAGVAVGWYLHRTHGRSRIRWGAAAALVAAAGCAVGVWALAAATSGPLGPGRMSAVGPDPTATAAAVGGLIAAGAVLAVLVARPQARSLAGRLREAVRGATRAGRRRIRSART